MDIGAYVAITLVVWAVTVIPNANLRAAIYSLPLPMSIAIVSVSPEHTSGNQLIGVFLLVAFFFVVYQFSRHVPNYLAVLIALAGYLIVTVTIERHVQLAWETAYMIAPFLWFSGMLFPRILPAAKRAPLEVSLNQPAGEIGKREAADRKSNLGLALCGSALATALSFGLGTWLGGFVVTFPYSGVAVALMWKGDRLEFCENFARRSVGLYLFLAIYASASATMTMWVSLGLAWAAFFASALLIWMHARVTRRLKEHWLA